MKKLLALLMLLASVTAIAACGSSSDDSQVTSANLASAMDEICSNSQADFDAMGTRGLTNPQLVLEFEGVAKVRQNVVDELAELNLDDEAQREIEPYLAASEEIIAGDEAIAKAAAEDDTEAVNKAFEGQNNAFDARDKAAKEIGTKVCGQSVSTEVEPTGTEPPASLNFAEPKNSTEAAANGYLKAVRSGDCGSMNSNRHTDAGELDEKACAQASETLKDGAVTGTESYGPVGQAEIVAAGVNYPTFFVEDLDGVLRYGGDVINDNGGLRPAPDGNDSQESVNSTFAAIRDSDGAAFNAALPDESSDFWLKEEGEFDTFSDGEYNAPFVSDVRDGEDDPVQLGINSTFGFYYYEGSENDWVITTVHIPGIGGHYRFSGYWPVPKPTS